jgi:hypothetical protein
MSYNIYIFWPVSSLQDNWPCIDQFVRTKIKFWIGQFLFAIIYIIYICFFDFYLYYMRTMCNQGVLLLV